MTSEEKNDEAIPMSQILRGASAEMAEAKDKDGFKGPVANFIEEDMAAMGLPMPDILDIEPLKEEAELPTFTAADGLGRDVATKIAEAEQRLRELQGDIEASGQNRDAMVVRAKDGFEQLVKVAQSNAETMIDMANNNHLQEVSVLRGRESDLIRTLGALRGVMDALRR